MITHSKLNVYEIGNCLCKYIALNIAINGFIEERHNLQKLHVCTVCRMISNTGGVYGMPYN